MDKILNLSVLQLFHLWSENNDSSYLNGIELGLINTVNCIELTWKIFLDNIISFIINVVINSCVILVCIEGTILSWRYNVNIYESFVVLVGRAFSKKAS